MKTYLTVTFTLLCIVSQAQNLISEFNSSDLFQDRGEIYFMLKNSSANTDALTKIISIDKVKDGNVYAYASMKEFNSLKEQFNFELVNLPKPGELSIEPVTDDFREVLEWDVYPSYSSYLQLMQQFAIDYPELCIIDTIGTSVEGRLLLAARISDNVGIDEDEPEFLYTSSMHGDEITGYVLTLHLIDHLLTNYGSDERVTNLVNNIDIWINPLANPDGTYAGGNNTVYGSTRYNANYVDLNRNYPDPADGPHPDGNPWQAETVAFMNFAEHRNFVMAANFHGGAEVVNYPWDTWSRNTADYLWWHMVSRKYADTVHEYSPNGYFTDLDNGVTNGYAWYSINGGRQDYMNYFQQCREVTLEISSTKLIPANQLIDHWNYNYRSMINYMEEVLFGVRGVVTDSLTGQPLKAEIFIPMHDKDSSMVFSSLPIGNYHRLLKAGTYNITFRAPGYISKTIPAVSVSDGGSTLLNVQLYNGMPLAQFTASDTLIEKGETIMFNDNSFGSPVSRIWVFEGGYPSTSTESNPSVQYPNIGTFDVTLIVNNGVGADTLVKENYITVTESIGMRENELSDFLVYPNPVTGDKLFITTQSPVIAVEVSDVTGAIIYTETPQTGLQTFISTSHLKDGIYFVTVITQGKKYTTKIIVKK